MYIRHCHVRTSRSANKIFSVLRARETGKLSKSKSVGGFWVLRVVHSGFTPSLTSNGEVKHW